MVHRPKSSVWVDVNRALLIKEEDLRYLHNDLAKTFGDDIAYRADCLDGTELRFDGIDELISFENPNFRRIVAITVSCTHNDKIGLYLHIGARDSFFDLPFDQTNARYHVESHDDGELMKLRSVLNRRLGSMRPWYWILTLAKTIWVLWSLNVMYLVISGSYSLIIGLVVGRSENASGLQVNAAEFIAVGVALAVSLFLIAAPIERLRAFLFPRVFIATGRQKDEWEKRCKVLNVVLGLIGIGLVVSVAGGLIAQSIG